MSVLLTPLKNFLPSRLLKKFKYSRKVNNAYFNKLPNEIIAMIMSKLSAQDFYQLSKANRRLYAISNKKNSNLWELIFKKDFPHTISKKDLSWQKQYAKNLKTLEKFLRNLPNQEILFTDNIHPFRPEFGIGNSNLKLPLNLRRYIDSLSNEELYVVYIRTIKSGFVFLLKDILKSAKFQNLPNIFNNNISELEAFKEAGEKGYTETIKCLLENERFLSLPFYELDSALLQISKAAAENNQLEIIKYLLQNQRFLSLPYNQLNSALLEMLNIAAEKGFIKIIKYLLENKKILDLPSFELNSALLEILNIAAEKNLIKIMKYLLENERFLSVSYNQLNSALLNVLENATKNNKIQVIKLLLQNERLLLILPYNLNRLLAIFKKAARNGFIEAIKVLIESQIDLVISYENLNSIKWEIFTIAFENENIEIIKLLIASKGFFDIAKDLLKIKLKWAFNILLEKKYNNDMFNLLAEIVEKNSNINLQGNTNGLKN